MAKVADKTNFMDEFYDTEASTLNLVSPQKLKK